MGECVGLVLCCCLLLLNVCGLTDAEWGSDERLKNVMAFIVQGRNVTHDQHPFNNRKTALENLKVFLLINDFYKWDSLQKQNKTKTDLKHTIFNRVKFLEVYAHDNILISFDFVTFTFTFPFRIGCNGILQLLWFFRCLLNSVDFNNYIKHGDSVRCMETE